MFNIFRRKRYTGHDCHYCDTPIREHVNQAIVLQGRYALRTMCAPCYADLPVDYDTLPENKI